MEVEEEVDSENVGKVGVEESADKVNIERNAAWFLSPVGTRYQPPSSSCSSSNANGMKMSFRSQGAMVIISNLYILLGEEVGKP